VTAESARATAPGRCTLVGEHVDYADGVVVCMAVHLGITVTLDRGGTAPPPPLVAATLQALGERGIALPQLGVAIEATLPAGAGLSSSAALCCATAVAALRLSGTRLPATELCDVALHAERDIAGVPCGPLDQRAVVLSPSGGALVLDCGRDLETSAAPWPEGFALAACHTGDTHDVGGDGYRSRRAQADAALRLLGAESFRTVDLDAVEALADPLLRRRARHIVTETRRALECAGALGRGDAARVGALMSASHASLRDDYEVSTPALDAVVAAAESTPGCLGARMCGAGFGGTAIALVDVMDAGRCIAAMQAVLPEPGGRGAWLLQPSPGLAALAPDVLIP